jgi:hypothetical protein
VNCIAADPDDPSFVTVGDDKAVAKWRKQKVAWKVTTASAGRAVAYHPAGSVVAVGTEDGHLVVLDSDGGTHVATQRLCGVSLNAVAYSKDGAMVAAAAQNGTVYIHQVTGNGRTYKKYGKMAGGEKLINLDWNISGTILRTVSEEHNVCYYNVRTNRIERASVAFRDEDWLEDTAIVSHAVAGRRRQSRRHQAVPLPRFQSQGGLLRAEDLVTASQRHSLPLRRLVRGGSRRPRCLHFEMESQGVDRGKQNQIFSSFRLPLLILVNLLNLP